MQKPLIIQNTTQDLLRLSPDEIMYIKSDGNYSQLWLYGHDEPVQLWMSLAAIADSIRVQMQGVARMFVRIGKQHVLNISYIHRIDTKKNALTLWRRGMNEPVILKSISHKALQDLTEGLLNDGKDEPKLH